MGMKRVLSINWFGNKSEVYQMALSQKHFKKHPFQLSGEEVEIIYDREN